MNTIIKNLRENATQYGQQEKFVMALIQEWKSSESYQVMVNAEKYSRNQNSAVDSRTRQTITSNSGNGTRANSYLTNDRLATNTKIQYPFFREFIDSKASFLAGRPISFNVNNTNDLTDVDDLVAKYNAELDNVFKQQRMQSKVLQLARNALRDGIGWLQVYYDENGILTSRVCDAKQIIPIWQDDQKQELDGLIRLYDIDIYDANAKKTTITKVEFYDNNGIWYYVLQNGNIVPDADIYMGGEIVPMPQFSMAGQGLVFDKIPFVWFRYNHDELSLLALTKTLIDQYSFGVADIANNIGDMAFAYMSYATMRAG